MVYGTQPGDGMGADAAGFDGAGGFPVLGVPAGVLERQAKQTKQRPLQRKHAP
jgi:hypothetical protein